MTTTNHTSPSGEGAANGAMGEAFDAWNDVQDALEFEDAEAEAHALFIFRGGWKAARAAAKKSGDALFGLWVAQDEIQRKINDTGSKHAIIISKRALTRWNEAIDAEIKRIDRDAAKGNGDAE